jgi:hypothetical protein
MAFGLEDLFEHESTFYKFLMPGDLVSVGSLNKKFRQLILNSQYWWKKLALEIFHLNKKLPEKTWKDTFALAWKNDFQLRRENEEELKRNNGEPDL